VVMHVRDTVPPGNGASTNATEYKDWISDGKNGTNTSYDLPNTYTFTVPPVRPNTVYYLGFRAKNDAIFSVLQHERPHQHRAAGHSFLRRFGD
jgi:hypothetical protein